MNLGLTMLMYFFNHEVFYYIKIIISLIVGALCVMGPFVASSSDKLFRENKNKEGRKKIIMGSIMLILGLSICYCWMELSKANTFKHFKEETYGVPEFLKQSRIEQAEKDKIRSAESKRINEERAKEKEKQREERKKQKELEAKKDQK